MSRTTPFFPRLATVHEGKEYKKRAPAGDLARKVRKNQQGASETTNSIKELREADRARQDQGQMLQVRSQLEEAILRTHGDPGHDRNTNHAALRQALEGCRGNPLVSVRLRGELDDQMSEASSALKAGNTDAYDRCIRRIRNDINQEVFQGQSSPNAERILALANTPAVKQD